MICARCMAANYTPENLHTVLVSHAAITVRNGEALCLDHWLVATGRKKEATT